MHILLLRQSPPLTQVPLIYLPFSSSCFHMSWGHAGFFCPPGFLLPTPFLDTSVSFFLNWNRHEFVLGTFSNLWKRLLKASCQMCSCLVTQRVSCQVYVQRIRQTIKSPMFPGLGNSSLPDQLCLRRSLHSHRASASTEPWGLGQRLHPSGQAWRGTWGGWPTQRVQPPLQNNENWIISVCQWGGLRLSQCFSVFPSFYFMISFLFSHHFLVVFRKPIVSDLTNGTR